MSEFSEVGNAITDELRKLPVNDRLTLLIGKVSACCVGMSSSPEMAVENGKRVKEAFDIVLGDAIEVRNAFDQFKSTQK